MKTIVVKSKRFYDSDLRIDATFHLSDGIIARKYVAKAPYEVLTIRDVSDSIFYGGRSKRYYVTNKSKGIPFIGSSDMLKSDLSKIKMVSKELTKDLKSSFLKKGWTLISRSGTIGNTIYVNNDFIDKVASEHIIRVVPKLTIKSGFLYAYLSSKYGYSLLTQGTFGAVIQHIEPEFIEKIPIPILPNLKQKKIHELIEEAANLRVEANKLLAEAELKLREKTSIKKLEIDDFDYYGPRNNRQVLCFSKNIKNVNSISINAFNHSKRIEKVIRYVEKTCNCESLYDLLDDKKLFSTGSFPRKELNSDKGIMLINQSDIFDVIIKGKRIAKHKIKTDNLVEYGEILIAGVGTLGENETFCRVIFANEEIQGQLVSGEFIRMKTTKSVPPGYLFCWLNTDYGFRFIRSTQSGTKLCRPIPKLLLELPVPILDKAIMNKIHTLVTRAHTLRFTANNKEKEAIQLVEKEIEQWQ
jgi:restriction endonuclease S subunit